MTGMVLALATEGTAPGSGSTAPGATSWASIYGTDVAYDSPVTITGITVPISITASKSSTNGTILYQLNGNPYTYTGAFTVHPGDYLAWGISCAHIGTVGTLTVTNATTSTVLEAISYAVFSSYGTGGYR